MKEEEQKRWNELVSTHWWIRGHHLIAKELIKKYLITKSGKNIRYLDIGCSGGHTIEFLKQFGQTYGFDISFDGLLHYKNRDFSIIQADATMIPFKSGSFDAIMVLEVAEHIEDDHRLFQEIYRICKKSAFVFIMVPAYKVLWGSHDVKYLHKRRYEKEELINLAKAYNFKIERLTFMHPHLLVPLFFIRAFDRMQRRQGDRDDFLSLGSFLDRLLHYTLLIENRLIRHFNFPFGICIFAILRKNE